MNYFVIGTSNLKASTKFYDSLLEQTELSQVLSTQRMSFWQGEDKDSAFAVSISFNKEPETNGNGTMFGFGVGSTDEVKPAGSDSLESNISK